MEEIHLKRRMLDHFSELLLTWWDESKGQQEGLLISCKCKKDCISPPTQSNCTSTAASSTCPVTNSGAEELLLRENLNIRSAPFVSKLMDSAYSGVALYADANSINTPASNNSDLRAIQPKIINIQSQSQPVPKLEVLQTSQPPNIINFTSPPCRSPTWRSKRPYPCDYCGKPFRTSYEKRRHEMIHTGNRPWKCTECNKAFVDRACLRNHMRKRHLGEKPYKCGFCDITFFDTVSRSTHEHTHEERQKAMQAEREAIQVKQEVESTVTLVDPTVALVDPTVAMVEVGEQLRQELLSASEQLQAGGYANKGVYTNNDGNVTKIKNEDSDTHVDVEMTSVFDITVIADDDAGGAVTENSNKVATAKTNKSLTRYFTSI